MLVVQAVVLLRVVCLKGVGWLVSTAMPRQPSGILKLVRVDAENNLLLIRGAVPGPNGGFVTVRETNKV